MDANRQRFWMLADAASTRDSSLDWDETRRVFRLRSHRQPNGVPEERTLAGNLAGGLPVTRDTYNTWAQPSTDRSQVLAGGAGEGPEVIFSADPGWSVQDLALGANGVLYILIDDGAQAALVWLDRRLRFEPYQLDLGTARPDRLTTLAEEGCYLLQRDSGSLLWARGEPLPERGGITYDPATPRPMEENRDPPRIEPLNDLILPADHQAIAIASDPSGRIGILLWPDAGGDPVLALMQQGGLFQLLDLPGGGAPYDLALVDEDALALRHADRREALVYRISEDQALPLGERYPVNAGPSINRRFARELTDLPHYLAGEGQELRLRPLHPLSMPALDREGSARLSEPFDSGQPGTVWHRIYIEAKLPPGTSAQVILSAADTPEALATSPQAVHGFGSLAGDTPVPMGAWVGQPSEIPYHQGLLDCTPEINRAGLFTLLVQTRGTRVRDLKGRYLDLQLVLSGNGHLSPEVAAVRVYGPRFAYRDHYLPALYHEELSGAEAVAEGDATGADFLGRLLGLCEGFLTPLEDKAAQAYLLTNPQTAPSEALDWLGRWVGLSLEAGLPQDQKRRMLQHAGSAYRRRGTLPGLELALDIATGGKVGRGAIVVLEDFRLRRTFATILGAELSVEQDPLLQDSLPSANSYVGDTLFLGDEGKREFMSLFSEELDLFRFEERAVARFHERLANRLTVLVHRDTQVDELRLIRRVVEAEAPAHIVSRVLAAGEPLLVGLRSLVAVNTWLDEKPVPEDARLGRSLIGRKDQIRRTPSLDPRLDAGA